jgi:hypothetical protein
VDKRFSFLLLAAALLLPAEARALPTQATYRALYNADAAGTLLFELDEQVPGACRYTMSWEYSSGAPSEQCVVDEATWIGKRSCFADALAPEESYLTLAPNWDCWGYDGAGRDAQVYLLVLGESAADGALCGLIQFDSASSPLQAIDATPMPSVKPSP